MSISKIVLLLSMCITTWAQSAVDFGAKYKTVTAYEVRPGIIMTPSYSPAGQVCELTLEKARRMQNEIVFGQTFSDKLIKELVNELVTRDERGKELEDFFNTTLNGGFITMKYSYQNISVEAHGTTRPKPGGYEIVIITWRNRVCGPGQIKGALQKASGRLTRPAM